jgi:zinc-ribbon domain
MSIEVKCPNGHTLKVKDKYAGQTGLCPKCQSRVLVPKLVPEMSEQAILDCIGPPPPADNDLPVHQDPSLIDPSGSASGTSLLRSSLLGRSMKTCPKCRAEVRIAYDLCPHCHTYFTDTAEVVRRIVEHCPHCGAEHLPGDRRCANCHTELRGH